MVNTRTGASSEPTNHRVPSAQPPRARRPPAEVPDVQSTDRGTPPTNGGASASHVVPAAPGPNFTLADIRDLISDCHRQARAEARAEILAELALLRPPVVPSPERQPRSPLSPARPVREEERSPPLTRTLEQNRSIQERSTGSDERPRRRRGESLLPERYSRPLSRHSSRSEQEAYGAPSRRTESNPPRRAPQRDVEEFESRRSERSASVVRSPTANLARPRRASQRDEVEHGDQSQGLAEVSSRIQHLTEQVRHLVARELEREGVRRVDHRPQESQPRRSRSRREQESPFVEEISLERLPIDARVPTSLPRYDGTSDPQRHLLEFEHLMELHGFSWNIYAKILVTTFQGVALEWFTKLRPASVHSYDDLTDKFLHRFAAKRQTPKPHTHLWSVKQGENESTRDFMGRFNDALMEVESPTVGFLSDVLCFGLRNRTLAGAIVRQRPDSLEKIIDLAHTYIDEEEMNNIQGGEKQSSEKGDNQKGGPRGRSPIKQYSKFTPLNAPRTTIYYAIHKNSMLKQPRKLQVTEKSRNSDKFCKFHKQPGHDTEHCFQLKNEIERLIRQGYLAKYADKQNNAEDGSKNKKQKQDHPEW